MRISRKRRRLLVLLGGGLCLAVAAGLVLSALRDNLTFFVAPSEIASKAPAPGRMFRLGGLVETGSVQRVQADGRAGAHFRVTDGAAAVRVDFAGILPDLFREGQGVVALGALQPDGNFRAEEVLAKHDETYMPKEVADALKRSGQWKPEGGGKPEGGKPAGG